MLYAQISLAIGAPTEEELERRVAVLGCSDQSLHYWVKRTSLIAENATMG